MPRLPALITAVLLLALPATAAEAKSPKRGAKTVQLKGTVVGSPYVASPSKSAVPVLITKQSAKRAGLASPVGVVIVPRRRLVATPEGRVLPGQLRLGDRWKGRTRISRSTRKAVYTRIAMKRIDVYRRSKTLSTEELESIVAQTRRDLASLQARVRDLSSQTALGLSSLRADVAGLRADLAALRIDLNALKAQVAALNAALESVRSELAARIDALDGDLAGLHATLSGLLARTQTVENRLDAVEASLAGMLQALAGLQTDLLNLGGTVSNLAGDLAALTTRVGAIEQALALLAPGDITGALTDIV
ncbi:MAG TPA: hypothetical protein VG474_15580, partial [Solirubrobacteraceae bacterium]|nr:hypothetical protein [Solirubrobacteraceae bacterium]